MLYRTKLFIRSNTRHVRLELAWAKANFALYRRVDISFPYVRQTFLPFFWGEFLNNNVLQMYSRNWTCGFAASDHFETVSTQQNRRVKSKVIDRHANVVLPTHAVAIGTSDFIAHRSLWSIRMLGNICYACFPMILGK